MEAADGGLQELLDELRGHGGREATGGPKGSAQQERRRRWSGRRRAKKQNKEAAGEMTKARSRCDGGI